MSNYSITRDRELKVDEKGSAVPIYIIFGGALAFATLIPLIIGWIVARSGRSYRLVHWVMTPVAFMLANISAFSVVLPISFVIALGSGMKNSLFMDLYTCSLIEQLWMPAVLNFWSHIIPSLEGGVPYFAKPDHPVPGLMIIAYQLVVWVILGRWFRRSLSLALFDLATCKIAHANGISPSELRLARAQRDRLYLKAALKYEHRNDQPIVSTTMMYIFGEDPYSYYN